MPRDTMPEHRHAAQQVWFQRSKAPPDMKTGRSMRTCLSRGVPADHEARSQVKVKETSERRRSNEASNEVMTEFRDVETQKRNSVTAQQRNSARDTAEEDERSQLTALRMDVHQPTQRSRRRYLACYYCPESESAMKTLIVRVDTAREQRDRHFSRARVEEVACERESSRMRCCKLPIRGTNALAANFPSRSGAMLSRGVGGGQKPTTES